MAIRLLDDQVINQIAAGEVVERPASVVKELLENALDAGAKRIQIRLRGGGNQRIRISDDGVGMARADALMSLERHATSKIRRTEDLDGVRTLGFRGEAIPSIAAVSRFQLVTRPADQEVGTRIRVEGGQIGGVGDAGCAAGTEIDVNNLFFNLPARKKFLRTVQTELSHCVEAVIREALVRPDVDFSVYHEDREILRAPVQEDRLGRARDLLRTDGAFLLPIRFEEAGIEVIGLISPLSVHRSTSSGAMYLYVNGRFVRDPVLRRAVNEAYRDLIPRGRYPVVVLDVRLKPGTVDVNVHPSKVEVRFRDPRKLARVVSEGLRDSLVHHGQQPPPSEDEAFFPSLPLTLRAPAPPRTHPLFAAEGEYSPAAPPPKRIRPAALPDEDPSFRPAPPRGRGDDPIEALLGELPEALPEADPPVVPAQAKDVEPSAGFYSGLRVLGTLEEAFLLCAGSPGLVAIALGPAQIRLLQQTLTQGGVAGLGSPQRLLAPVLLTLPRAQVDRLGPRLERLEALGIDAERFGPGEIAIKAVRPPLREVDLQAMVTELAQQPVAEDLRLLARHLAGEPTLPEDPVAWLARLDALEDPSGLAVVIGLDELTRRLSAR